MGSIAVRRIAGPLAAALTAGVLIAGCGSSGGDSTATSGTSAASTSAAGTSAATTEAAKKDVNLAMVMSFQIPYFIAAQHGAEKAVADDGAIKLALQAAEAPTGVKEVQMAENLLVDGPQGFAVNPCVLPAWSKVLKRMETEVPDNNVIAFSCKQAAAPGQTSPVRTFVGASDAKSGEEAITLAIDKAKLDASTKGTALVSECAKGTPILDERVAGAEKVLKQRLPNVKIVNFTTDPADASKNLSTWSSVVQDNPDAVIAFGPCDSDTGSIVTLKNKGSAGDVAVALLDPTEAGLQAIKSGKVTGGVSTAPWIAGFVTIDLLAKAARGEGAAPEGWIDTGTYPVTEQNIDEYLQAAGSPDAQSALFQPMAEKILGDLQGNTHPLDDSFPN
ncbi:sugar ABC transporter substrate-binding protein [Capillimicrobium parvum]|uniref:Periplasmic binding protein domain-containing protein n=1 Tax=Capillimicrobium parvum TaxID=2884022 RepID=A0A9E6XZN9_9ACTN|nr:sugar ABC transporter substrate-binding protein [Capillimicrobium parvum]UGS37286.1 hypothetical protein DSM104329_03701 [Capillimicrobium parvum]